MVELTSRSAKQPCETFRLSTNREWKTPVGFHTALMVCGDWSIKTVQAIGNFYGRSSVQQLPTCAVTSKLLFTVFYLEQKARNHIWKISKLYKELGFKIREIVAKYNNRSSTIFRYNTMSRHLAIKKKGTGIHPLPNTKAMIELRT